jgi:ribonuclease-3
MSFSDKLLSDFQNTIGYQFKDITWLKKALTHSSAGGSDFERLEYLGDRILSSILALWIFHRYPEDREGPMTKRLAYFVSSPRIYHVALSLNLASVLRIDKRQSPHHSRILVDACEALIAAIMLDSESLPCVQTCIERWWNTLLQSEKLPTEAKSRLQEWTQSCGYGLPVYHVVHTTGPCHKPSFEVTVCIADTHTFYGIAGTKQEAEQKAAQIALDTLVPGREDSSTTSKEHS